MSNMILGQEVQVKVEKSNFHKCPVKSCPMAFLDANGLNTHIKHHDKIFFAHIVSSYVKIERVKIFECDSCRQSFLSKNKLLLHRLKHINKSVQYAKESEKYGGKAKLYKCSECDYQFVAKSTLEAHSIYHEPFPYICYCGIGYYQLQDLKSHKKLVHSAQNTEDMKSIYNSQIKPYKSKTNFTARSKKRSHGSKLKAEPLDVKFKNKDGRYQCPDCLKTLGTRSAAELHYRSLHRGERPYICNLCGKAFTQSSALNNHLLIHAGDRNFACQYCNKPFLTFHSRALHERTHTGVKPYKCSYCEKAFSDPSAYKRHERIHTGDKKYVCQYCPKAFTDSSALYIHRKRHTLEKNFTCEKCGNKFYTKSNLRMHFEVVHNHKYGFECDYCHKDFSSKANLQVHILNRHSVKKKAYHCNVCFKIFRHVHYLQNHMKVVHDRRRDYTCNVCCKQFVTKCLLDKHIVVHSDVKKFECAHCSRKCYTKAHLRCHILSQHTTKNSCEVCKRNFTSASYLKQHKLKIAERCNICGQEFFCKGEVNVHHNRVHALNKTVSMYECDYCGLVFAKYRLIKKHIFQFHSKPKYICEHCGNRFALKESIRSHIMTHHVDVLRCNNCYKRFYSSFELQTHKRVGCTVIKHPCEICDRSFSTARKLRLHTTIHMINRKRYKCPLCSKKLLFKPSVIRHMILKHSKSKKIIKRCSRHCQAK